MMAAVLMSLAFLVHLTTAMVAAPGRCVGVRCGDHSRPAGPNGRDARKLTAVAHVAVWMIPLVVLAVNCVLVAPGNLAGRNERTERFRFRPP